MFKVIVCLALILVFSHNVIAQESSLESLDNDNDGKVTIAEFTQYARQRLPQFDRLKDFVARVDADQNGTISKTEFQNRMNLLREMQSTENETPTDNAPQSTIKTDREQIKQAYKSLRKLVKDGKWAEATGLMTQTARDDYCVQQVVGALGLIESDVPFEMPSFTDTVDELHDILVKYDLDRLGIKVPALIKVRTSIDDESESDSSEDESADMPSRTPGEQDRAKILKALDQDSRRWKIIQDLYQAQLASPFMFSVLNGQIHDVTVDGNDAYLQVKLVQGSSPEGERNDGMVVQIVSPPIVLHYEKIDQKWMFAGRDQKRSEALRREFEQNAGH